jgi:hypothetical protein
MRKNKFDGDGFTHGRRVRDDGQGVLNWTTKDRDLAGGDVRASQQEAAKFLLACGELSLLHVGYIIPTRAMKVRGSHTASIHTSPIF